MSAFQGATAFQGGAAVAAGLSPNALPMGDFIDLTDGSWTLLDPDSLVDSVSFDGTYNQITWNALGAGSADYVWDAGTAHRCPRWYKALEIDGVRATSDDIIHAFMRIANDDSLRELPNKVVAGASVDPTSTVPNTIGGAGAIASALIAGTVTDYGVWTIDASTAANAVGGVSGLVTQQYGGRHAGSGAFHILDSSKLRVQNGSRNGAVALSSAADLYWVVGAGARGSANTWLAGVRQKFSLKTYATKLVLP